MPTPQVVEAPKRMGLSPDSAARIDRCQKRKVYDCRKRDCRIVGKKPHQLEVKIGGEIDAGCDGKNAWDAALRLHVPRVLDISIID
jgi:hypothetical protein